MPAIIFAFYRELFAGLVLLAITVEPLSFYEQQLLTRSQLVKRCHWKRLFLVGLCMFGNQVFFIVGLSFAPAHVASIWQVGTPVCLQRDNTTNNHSGDYNHSPHGNTKCLEDWWCASCNRWCDGGNLVFWRRNGRQEHSARLPLLLH